MATAPEDDTTNVPLAFCLTCHILVSQMELDKYKGECSGCRIFTSCYGRRRTPDDCFRCGKSLTTPTKDGPEYDINYADWDPSKYHKACWRNYTWWLNG